MAPKNYFLYFHNGKVKRQAINLNDIYPESYAAAKIPDGADIFARIIGKNYGNGYRSNSMDTQWMKHTIWTSYYPDNDGITFKDAELYHANQLAYIEKFIPLIAPDEVMALENSTAKIRSRIFQDGI